MNPLMNAAKKIATTGTSSKKSTVSVYANAEEDTKKAVDKLIKIKGKVTDLQAEALELGETIIDEVYPQQKKLAKENSYTKSLKVSGEEGELVYTTSDKFTVPQDKESLQAIKKLVGKKMFEDYFEDVTVISIKPETQANEAKAKALFAALKKASLDFESIFNVTTKTITKKGLDEKQFGLSEEKLETFRTLVKQYKASLKY